MICSQQKTDDDCDEQENRCGSDTPGAQADRDLAQWRDLAGLSTAEPAGVIC